MQIGEAKFPRDCEVVAEMFREYADSLDFDLGFQSFDEEIRSLPGAFAEPVGRVLLASDGRDLTGVVGLRPLDDTCCEMKRLFVRPEARARGIGRGLALGIIAAGRNIGYSRMRLDTEAEMTAANALYQSLGFREIDAYCHNPLPNPRFYELLL